MSFSFEIFQDAYAIRALIASAMVGVMCGVLGAFIVLRNMSLIGDALSHAILPGVVAGFMIAGYSMLGFFLGSVVAGLVAAVLITWIQRNVKTREDAAIGIVFTSMFALGVIGISHITRKQGVHLDLKDFLFGNILGISDQDLWLTGTVLVFTLLSVVAFYRYFFITTFESVIARTVGIPVGTVHYFLMLLLSFAIVASLRTVGVILVVAMLITPASTAYLLTHKLKTMLWLSGLIGLLSTLLGLLIAIVFQTTPGPAMAVTATGFYLLAVGFAPQRGLLAKYRKRRRKQMLVLREDVLKQTLRLHSKQQLSFEKLQEKLDISSARLRQALRYWRQKGYLMKGEHPLKLTDKGFSRAVELVRAHRLWETYLVERMGLQADQIHEDAERYEHILTADLLEEMDANLGYPALDPHGSPIPRALREGSTLASLQQGAHGQLSLEQTNDLVRSRLWEMGLGPGDSFQLEGKEGDSIRLKVNGKQVKLGSSLARHVRVEEGG
jgi:ABC-type Mn2+/Zn2+ transport system permease subunit/Mn-dependent DtxR family transcriptional regulator